MARPTKYRTVEFFPEGNYFVPLGKKECELEEVELKVEELEAIRLKDIEGLTQEECAKKMDILFCLAHILQCRYISILHI